MENPKQLPVKFKDEDLKGEYSNVMQIAHAQEEFLLDFFFAFPPQGALIKRIVMSPGHIKRMLRALQENVKKYEEKFGEIKEMAGPESEIGFHS